MRLLVGLATLVAGVLGVAGAALAATTVGETLQASPPSLAYISADQAVAYLNQQRAENGIPGDLTTDENGSLGCWQYTNIYRPAPGQYPHEELAGQPGYTSLGDEAASSSDLSGKTTWGSDSNANPWFEAPLHLTDLFDPAATSAWYGETQGKGNPDQDLRACMGTGQGSTPRTFSTQSFYSLPGDGTTDVVFAQPNGGEEPWTPAEAAGLPSDSTNGPTIILWPQAPSSTDAPGPITASLQDATLTGPAGPVLIKTVTPDTPAPQSPAGWPTAGTVGNYTDASFVIPVKPLQPDSRYVLTANWQTTENSCCTVQTTNYTQVVHFTTLSTLAEQNPTCPKCATGKLTLVVSKGRATVRLLPAVGQKVQIIVGVGSVTCEFGPMRPNCPESNIRYVFDPSSVYMRTIRDFRGVIVVNLPPTGPGSIVGVMVNVAPFRADGYQWPRPSTICGTVCVP